LAAAGGMADMNGVLQVEMRRHGREVVGVMVHVVAVGHLAGAAMAAAIMGDDPKAVVLEKQHLRVPVVGRQRPAVAEHDRLPLAPILVEDLDAVLGRDGGHGNSPLVTPSMSIKPADASPPASQSSAEFDHAGRNRRHTPMIMTTKNTSTMPCTTANTGPLGGLPGASAVKAGILRKLWITSTKTL